MPRRADTVTQVSDSHQRWKAAQVPFTNLISSWKKAMASALKVSLFGRLLFLHSSLKAYPAIADSTSTSPKWVLK
jgi:hypothetical protein